MSQLSTRAISDVHGVQHVIPGIEEPLGDGRYVFVGAFFDPVTKMEGYVLVFTKGSINTKVAISATAALALRNLLPAHICVEFKEGTL